MRFAKVLIFWTILCIALLSVDLMQAQDNNRYFPEVDLSNPAAPFIFTHDYAIAQGATAEWRKMEGVIIDAPRHKLYIAVASIKSGMSDEAGDIQLAENPCGMVLVGDLDASWNVTELHPLIIGGPLDESGDTNNCNLDNVAEPDNLFVDGNGDLWIGEDSDDHHTNNMLWKYEIATGKLMRFATAPLGAEFTGLRILDDGTLFFNIQHPDDTNLEPFNVGTVGYVSGYKATDPVTSVAVPEGDAQRTLQVATGEYVILGRSGDSMPQGAIWGETAISVSGRHFQNRYCNKPDGNMFIPMGEGTAILYTNWECTPGGVSKATLQWSAEGRWEVVAAVNVDFRSVRGTLNNCNASVTPWGTGITSEESAPRSADEWYGNNNKSPLDVYLETPANPYDYGYNIEIIPNADGTETLIRHYAMGRRDNEQAWVAPDNRTVYFGDDSDNKIFYKFIADTEGDLSVGTLYAAKLTQTGTDKSSDFAFTLEWIELGHGNNADIEAAVRALDPQK